MSPPLKNCRSCNATVFWARSNHGKRQILDAHPIVLVEPMSDPSNYRGRLVLGDDGVVYPASAEDVGQRPLYVSHFATCPHANDWRNRQ